MTFERPKEEASGPASTASDRGPSWAAANAAAVDPQAYQAQCDAVVAGFLRQPLPLTPSEREAREDGAAGKASAAPAGVESFAAQIGGQLGVAPRVDAGEAGRRATEARGAHGVAQHDMVAIHPDVDAGARDGRATIAHEMIHQAQARLPASADVGRGAAESEAAALATTAADGGAVTQPTRAIDLSRPAADRDAKPDADPPPPAGAASLGAGVPFQVQGGALVVTKAWMADAPGLEPIGPHDVDVHAPKRIKLQLTELRAAGVLPWISDDQIRIASSELTFGGPYAKKPDPFTWHLESSAFTIIGPPPGTDIHWMPWGDGMLGVFQYDLIKAGSRRRKHAFQPEPALRDRMLAALEATTGLRMAAEARRRLPKHPFTLDAEPNEGIIATVERADLENLFGRETWASYLDVGFGAGGAAGGTNVLGHVAIGSEARADDLLALAEFLDEVGADTSPPTANQPPPTTASPYLFTVLRRINALAETNPDLRKRIIDHLRGSAMLTGAEPLDGFGLDRLIEELEFEQAMAQVGITPAPGARVQAPQLDAPVRGHIVNRSGGIIAEETAAFSFERTSGMTGAVLNLPRVSIQWATQHLPEAPTTPPGASVEAEPVIPPGATLHHGPVVKAGTEGDEGDYRLKLAPGFYAVHAFVNHNFYRPAHFWMPVEVKTEATRSRELNDETFGAMGDRNLTEFVHDFETGLLDDAPLVGRGEYHNGQVFRGELPADWKRQTPEQRLAWLDTEQERVRRLIKQYGESKSGSYRDIADYARHYLSTLTNTEKRIQGELKGGAEMFECRATYVSRQAGIPDAALRLTATAVQTGQLVSITLHDHTKLYEPQDYHFKGVALDGKFETALENAFVNLCKSYPAGTISLHAETLGADDEPTGKTIGYELDTGGVWKDVKSAVWDPTVQIAVNIAGAVMMVFLPVSAPAVLLALAAYNAVDTIDNLETMRQKGTVTNWDTAAAIGQIAMDLLPFLGRAKPFLKTASRTMMLIDGVQLAGAAALVTVDGLHQLEHIRDKDIAEIAQLQAWIDDPNNQSHPDLPQRKRDLEAMITRTREEGTRLIDAMVKQGAIMVAPNLAFTKVSSHIMASKLEELAAMNVLRHEPDLKKPYYDPTHGQIVVPENLDELGFLEIERLQKAYVTDLATRGREVAEVLGVDATKVVVQPGDKLAVTTTGDGFEVTAPPGTPREEILDAVWRHRQVSDPSAPKQRPAISTDSLTPRFDAAAIAGEHHVVVGAPVADHTVGLDVMRKIAAGDPEGFAAIGVHVGDDFDAPGVEWGLGRRGNEYVIVKGAAGEVDWGKLPDVVGLAHSHHMTPSRQLRGKGLKLKELLKGSTDASGAINRGLVLPSAADFGYCAHNGVPRHVVVTPYVFDKKSGRIRNPGPGDEGLPRIEFELKRPDLVGDFEGNPDIPVYKAQVIISAGGDHIETQTMWSIRHPALGDVVEPNAIPAKWRSRTPGEAPPDVTRSTHKPDDSAPADPETTYTYPDRTKFVDEHGPDVVRWAEDSLGSQAKGLLESLPTKTLTALGDIPAKEAAHLVSVIGKDTIAKVVPPLSGGDVATDVELLGTKTTVDHLTESAQKPSTLRRLKPQAESLGAARPTLAAPTTLSPDSIVADTNAVIALAEAVSDKPWSDLDAGRIAALNRIRKANGINAPLDRTVEPPARDLKSLIGTDDVRLANMVFAEAGRDAAAAKGSLHISVSRQSQVYKDMLAQLEKLKVGGLAGAGDRAIVADALFATGGPARLVTGDDQMAAPLVDHAAPGSYATLVKGRQPMRRMTAIAKVHGGGLTITLHDSEGKARSFVLLPYAEGT